MSGALKHYATPTFWEKYEQLPENIKKLADKNFELLKKNPYHPSLHLKKVGRYWSVRVGKKYRAIGIETEEGIIWFWIGKHSEYEKIINV
jgi:mRNA-degrading endonuclease RelE of RelBE toxin-antitoxin system